MSKTKKIAYFGIAIALYVVLGMTMKIPLIAHIGTDFGYVVFGFCCYAFGWQAFIIGVIGCMFESLIVSGWIPIGWMLGQTVIGLICGCFYKKRKQKWMDITVTIVAVCVGIAIVKTLIECKLYAIPIAIKFPRNIVAFIADVIPMLIGLFIGYRYSNKFVEYGRYEDERK